MIDYDKCEGYNGNELRINSHELKTLFSWIALGMNCTFGALVKGMIHEWDYYKKIYQ